MQERDKRNDEEELPRRESWQREDEKSLIPLESEVDADQELDTIQESPVGYVLEGTEVHPDSESKGEDISDEVILIGTNADEMMNQIGEFTSDPEVLEDFSERQGLNSGSDQLLEKLSEHYSKKPGLSAGDIDAAWEDTDVSGEESAGGTVVTPDQDIVEEIGEALGLEYADDELLNTEDKLAERDQDRWELDPASAEGQLDEEGVEEEDLFSELEAEFSEIEGELTAFQPRNPESEEGWEDLFGDEDKEIDFDEFAEEMDEDFFELLDDMQDED